MQRVTKFPMFLYLLVCSRITLTEANTHTFHLLCAGLEEYVRRSFCLILPETNFSGWFLLVFFWLLRRGVEFKNSLPSVLAFDCSPQNLLASNISQCAVYGALKYVVLGLTWQGFQAVGTPNLNQQFGLIRISYVGKSPARKRQKNEESPRKKKQLKITSILCAPTKHDAKPMTVNTGC